MAEEKKKSDLPMMIGLGVVAVVGIVAVVAGMSKKPTLNDETEDAGAPKAPAAMETTTTAPTGEHPYDPQGRFTIDDARHAVAGSGPFLATIRTSKGDLTCALWEDKAPNTVANFVGLATGARAWKPPGTTLWVNRPAYDNTTFHRTIQNFMIQGGDPVGNGTGEPGYTIPDEIWEGAKHDRPGLLCMANRGHDTNGAQFFITDAPAAHLDGNYTIFGSCTPIDVIHDIARVPVQGDRPVTPITIKTVKITRT